MSFAILLTVSIFVGDSIAVGFGGSNPGERVVGASPSEVYQQLLRATAKDPNALMQKVVNISTGISNNPLDTASIQRQFELLKKSGAQVNVLGAAMGRYDKQNQLLQNLSNDYGFNFLGGFQPGNDRVHPLSYATYNGLSLSQAFGPNQGQLPTRDTVDDAVVKVLAKYKGVAGELNKTSGKFTAREWSPEESKRYDYYKNLRQ